ncbi:hypothetical protein [Paenibacillus ginsengarvi]|uniref:hypothetical protein n=1 Tax=Paenibacillus ginsengarvi TaxID=400777 RepID=UPI001F030C7A|nr:hypothetical protein [Paenibacillus ginsengarvi]
MQQFIDKQRHAFRMVHHDRNQSVRQWFAEPIRKQTDNALFAQTGQMELLKPVLFAQGLDQPFYMVVIGQFKRIDRNCQNQRETAHPATQIMEKIKGSRIGEMQVLLNDKERLIFCHPFHKTG